MPTAISLSNISSDLLEAKQELSKRYLSGPRLGRAGMTLFSATTTANPKQNVVGVGIGEKITEEGMTGVLSIKLFV